MPWATVVVFLLPALVLYSVFLLYPIVQSTRYSLYDWNGLEPLDQFIGLANFERALSDTVFLGSVSHNAFIVIMSRRPANSRI